MKRYLSHLLLIFALFLSGCLSTRYGVDQETWDSLTEAQKDATIASYNQRKEVEAQQRLLQEERLLLEAKMEYNKTQQETARAITNAPRIRVIFRSGQIKYGSKYYSIRRTEVILEHGFKSHVNLKHNGKKDVTIRIPIAYQKGRFIFGEDEGSSSRKSSLQYKYEDDWKRGKLYFMQKIPIHADYSGNITLEVEAVEPHTKRKRNDDLIQILVEGLLD